MAAGLLWAQLFPPLRAPDEPFHLDMVRRVGQDWEYPRRVFSMSPEVFEAYRWSFELSATDRYSQPAPFRGARPSLEDPPPPATTPLNQMYQHPPAQYFALTVGDQIGAPFLRDRAVDQRLSYLRFLSLLLALPVPWLIASAVRRLGGGPAAQITAALAPLAVPQFTASLGTLGNDTLVVTFGAAACALVAAILTGDHRVRTAVALGAVAGLASLVKGFGLALWVVPLVFLLITGPWLSRLRLLVTATAAALGAAGWWWMWNLADFGKIQPHGIALNVAWGPPPPGFDPRPWEWIQSFVPWIIERSWGWFGSFHLMIRLDPWLVATASLAAIIAIAVAVIGGTAAQRRFALLAGLVLMVALAILVKGAYDLWSTYARTAGIQGRYLFVALPGVAVVAGLGLARLLRGRVFLFVLAAVIMQAFAVLEMLRGWWGPFDGRVDDQLAAMRQWSPWGVAFFLVIAVIGLSGLALLGPSLVQIRATSSAGEPTLRIEDVAVQRPRPGQAPQEEPEPERVLRR